jgi:hypothetical protein
MPLATRRAMSNFAAIDLETLDTVNGGADAPSAPTTGQELGSAAKRCATGAAVGAVTGGALGAITTGGPGVLPGAGVGAAVGCARGIVNKVNPAY